ncbi:MAG: hypothetical protein GPJ51_15485 [Candidatus Heimdallarchaeota archaeon]|nr:hypothetical protein [Candidatus Heimdallarchaeota archaeon]
MSVKYSKVLAFLLFFLFLVSIQNVTNTAENIDETSDSHSLLLLINHAPILIKNDTAFSFYGFPGNGTPESPFLIQNLNITTNVTSGIEIINTSKFFIISDCYIDADSYGIHVSNVSAGTAQIINNTCTNHLYHGIRVLDSNYTTVTGNICKYNSWHGIVVGSSHNPIISNNYCTKNNWVGLYLSNCNSSIASNNTCTNNLRGGLLLDGSKRSFVEKNSCHNNTINGGIRLVDSNSSYVTNNYCSDNLNNNIFVIYSSDVIVTDNSCFASGRGIFISSSENCSVENNYCSTSGIGIWVKKSENSRIYQNQLENCGFEFSDDKVEIFLTYEVSSNLVNGKPLGFLINLQDFKIRKSNYGQLVIINCTQGVISNQIISNTHIAISVLFSNQLMFKDSILSSNNEGGIHLRYSYSIEVLNSISTSNGLYGILAEYTSYCSITYNTFESNPFWGVVLDLYSKNNSIHHNSFRNNNQYYGTAQAKDDGQNNLWYDLSTLEGNYWEDYLGVGSYSIDGFAGTEDPYPLSEPPVYRNKNIYYSFLSLVVLIPLIVFGYFRFSSKRKR